MPYILLPLASDSAVGFMGFTLADVWGGILYSGVGALSGGCSFCAHSAKAKKSNIRTVNARTGREVFWNIDGFDAFSFNTHLQCGRTVETDQDTLADRNVH